MSSSLSIQHRQNHSGTPSLLTSQPTPSDQKTSQISHQLLLLKTVHGGFVSRDMQAQLLSQGVTPQQLHSIE